MKPLLITIDGPAGAGKTTVSRALADRLGYTYVDTGALYRGVAREMKVRQVDPEDEKGLAGVLADLDLRFVRRDRDLRLLSAGVDITGEIRNPEITMLASAASARPEVRRALLALQRRLGAEKSAVFEGRDMGTVVFPDADVKFFLIADLHVRARRRYLELAGDPGLSLEQVEKDMQKRDANDAGRCIAPLKAAGDAVYIDSTSRDATAVVDEMMAVIRDTGRGKG